MTPRKVTIKILNEVNILLLGLHGDHIKYFYDNYGVFVPSYNFNPKYKLGVWDGKIHFFSKDGKTYLFLIEEILPQLKKFGYTIELIDNRQNDVYQPDFIDENILSHSFHPRTNDPIILRDYQVDAVNSLIKFNHGLCLASTSSGKTKMCAALILAYNTISAKSITIVPSQTLIKQTKQEYINCEIDVGEYSGKEKSLNHPHVVSTWQALKNNLAVMNQFNMVIIDECHQLIGPTLQKIITVHGANIPYRFGFTGTLPKDPCNKMLVHVAVGPTRFSIPAHELIERGVLSTIQIDIMILDEDLRAEYAKEKKNSGIATSYEKFKQDYFGDYDAEKSYIHRKQSRIEWIASFLQIKLDATGNVLCLVDDIAFGRRITELLPNAIFVNGTDVKSASKRQKIYDMFETRDDLIVIATVHIAGTGLSIDRIFNLVTIDIGKSFTRVIQAVGRGLRKGADKSHISYSDICSDLKYGKKHLTERIKYYKEAKYKHSKKSISYHDK
ncbi:MAG: DEAD/DEAH box helicase family protein [Nitrososphaeraceae archaeon]